MIATSTDPLPGPGPHNLPSEPERRAYAAGLLSLLRHLGSPTQPDPDSLGVAGCNVLATVRRDPEAYRPRRLPERPAQLPHGRAASEQHLERHARDRLAWRAQATWVRSQNVADVQTLIAGAVMLRAAGVEVGAAELVEVIRLRWGVTLPRLPALDRVAVAAEWVVDRRAKVLGVAA